MEITFLVNVYPVESWDVVEELRERLQEIILTEVEARGLYMGPVVPVEEVEDVEKA